MFLPTQSAAQRGSLAKSIQAQTDGVSLSLALLFGALCPQDERQALGAAHHAASQRCRQHVNQVLPHACEDEAGEHGPWRREEGKCFHF